MDKPLKVLYMLHDSRRSGVPAVVSAIIMALDKSRVIPSVLFAYDGIYARELREQGVEVVIFGKKRPFVWRIKRFLFNLHLLRLVRRVDIVHVHSIKLAFSVIFAKCLGGRVIFHLHELPGKIGAVLRAAIGMADCVVFCSETCAARFAGIPVRKSRVILNAVNPDGLVGHAGNNAMRRIVMIGSINKTKGQDLLLKAFAKLTDKDVTLFFYGTTGLSAHWYVHGLKRFARKNGIVDRVFFPGPTNDVEKVLQQSTILVHTSWKESFGMALVEAMTCGVPVIAHDLSGMKEVVVDGLTGFLVKPNDIDMLAERISRLINDPDLRQRFGQAGRELVMEKYNIASRCVEYMELYKEMCGPRTLS